MGFFDNLFGGNTGNQSTDFTGNQRSGLINIGDNPYSSSIVNNYSDDDVTNITNILGSSVGGSVGNTTLQRKTTDITSEPISSVEKPLSFAPALFGGGTTTATGEATSGISLTPIVAVLGGVVLVGGLGYVFISNKKGKKK